MDTAMKKHLDLDDYETFLDTYDEDSQGRIDAYSCEDEWEYSQGDYCDAPYPLD